MASCVDGSFQNEAGTCIVGLVAYGEQYLPPVYGTIVKKIHYTLYFKQLFWGYTFPDEPI